MAAILRHKLADEFGLPHWLEAVNDVEGRKARILRIDENKASMLVDDHLMDVQIASNLRIAWNEQPVKKLICTLVAAENIFEPPHRLDRCDVDTIGLANQTHRTDEVSLMNRDSLVWERPDKKKLTSLIGRKREAHIINDEPIGETTRAFDIRCLNLLRFDFCHARDRGLCGLFFRDGRD